MINCETDLSSSSIIRNSNDLNSDALLQLVNFLDIEYVIQSIEDFNELDGYASVSWFEDLISNLMVRVRGFNELQSSAYLRNINDLLSIGYNPYKVDLLSKIGVTEHNILDIVFKLMQAPIMTMVCNAMQDSYIRQFRPTLNYGTNQSLVIGEPLEGEYLTLLQIDISPFNRINIGDTIILENCNLVLTVLGDYPASIIEIYEVSTNWSESTITWSNFNPDYSKLVTQFTCTGSKAIIDITDHVLDRQNRGYSNINLLFRFRDIDGQLIYFESNNSLDTSSRPRLEIYYRDSNWSGYLGDTNLNCSSILRVTNAKDLDSTLTIKKYEKIEIVGNAVIQQNKSNNLESNVRLRKTEDMDINSISNLLPGSDIISSTIIRRTDDNDINGLSKLYIAKDIDSIVDIKTFSTWLNGYAIIKQNSNKDIDNIVNIRHNIDMQSNAVLRLSKDSNLTSSVKIRITNNKNLDSVATILNLLDLNSSVSVKRSLDKDLISTVRLRLSNEMDLDSQLYVKYGMDLDSSAVRRLSKDKDLISLGNIYHGSDLDSIIQVISRKYDSNKDLESTSITRVKNYSDITSSVCIRNNLDLDSKAIQRLTNKNDLDSFISVFQTLDINCNSNIYRGNDLLSSLIIRRFRIDDLPSNLIARQFDIEELCSSSYLLGMEILQLDSTCMISRFEVDYLNCTATIHTNARRWIPNIHGRDIFNYGDRKYPRVWKRENFIP